MIVLMFFLLSAGCDQTSVQEEISIPALQEVFSEDFYIGTALNRSQIFGQDERSLELVRTHFNTITPENILKWQHVHPNPGEYNFEPADRYVEFGEQEDMFIVGHTLVWHSQTPDWVFKDDEGDPMSREAMIERMRDHIHTVVGRYQGRIDGWDVVNEALNEDGSLRQSPWLEIIGEDYISLAFEFAREADPQAELYYNDYSLENPSKREGAVRLIESLQEQGVPVTGIGTQGHYSLEWPPVEEVDATISAFANLGIDVMVTELDVDVLPRATDGQGADISRTAGPGVELNPYPEALPDLVQQSLARRYAHLFETFLRHREVLTRVTFWGVTDGHSWKNNWPVRGRTNYPLLFDRNWEPKPAFHSVVEVARRD
ncbi:MAG: endo-1,4-beta-xylanase [Balneolaceae bacterium]